MNFVLDFGTVVSVNGSATDRQGKFTPNIGVKSFLDGSDLTIPMAWAAWEQVQPIEGYKALFIRFGRHHNRLIKLWGNDEEFVRKGARFGLNPGEVVIQSPKGLGYIKLDQAGRVQIVDGDTKNKLEFLDDGITIKAPQIFFRITDKSLMEMTEDGVITMQQFDGEGNVKASFQMDEQNRIILETDSDIILKGKTIQLDGEVFLGSGASEAAQRTLFQGVVSGSPLGTHPFDFTTGLPIKGSGGIKIAPA